MQNINFQEPSDDIDWKLVQQQKRELEKLLMSLPLSEKKADILDENSFNLWGRIELIETLQNMQRNEGGLALFGNPEAL